MSLDGGQAGGFDFRFGGAGLAQDFPLLHIFDVQAPPGQTGGQAGVLPVASDGQGHLVFGDDHIGGSFGLVDFNGSDIGGAQGAGDEGGGIGIPLNDVDLFALEFVDDALDAVAAQPDAGAYGIHAILSGGHGDFAADAGVAGDGADFHGAVADFGYFRFYQAAQQVAVGAADDDFGAAGGLLDFHQEDFDVLPLAVAFPGNLVFVAHHAAGALVLGLVGVEVNVNGAVVPFYAVHAAVDDFALEGGILLKDLFPLGFAQSLDQHLAGGLRRNAAGVVVDFVAFGDLAAQFHVGRDLLGFGQDDLRLRVVDFVHDGAERKDADVAGVGVELDGQVAGAGHAVAAEGRGQGQFHFVQHQVFAQPAFCG